MEIKKCFDSNGFPDYDYIMGQNIPFIVITGGRGIGKTFGALYWHIKNKQYFMYLRRTQVQVDTIASDEFNVFRSINVKKGSNIYCFKKGQNYICAPAIYDDKGKLKQNGEAIGVISSLATLSNKRGFSADNITTIIFDEVIPEKHERPIKGEDEVFQNAYETINRNRELEGEMPVRCIMTTNSNGVNSRILNTFGIVPILERMHKQGKRIYINANRTLLIINMEDSPISERKKTTLLYSLVDKSSEFYKMAISNSFSEFEQKTKSEDLRQYKPLVTIGKITIYKHKSQNTYYCTYHRSGTCDYYPDTEMEIKKAQRRYNFIKTAYFENKIIFESISCKVDFEIYYNI